MVLLVVEKPKNLPPSIRMSILEQFGLAHFEIMTQKTHYVLTSIPGAG